MQNVPGEGHRALGWLTRRPANGAPLRNEHSISAAGPVSLSILLTYWPGNGDVEVRGARETDTVHITNSNKQGGMQSVFSHRGLCPSVQRLADVAYLLTCLD